MKNTIRLFPVYNVNIIVTIINYIYLCKSKYLKFQLPIIIHEGRTYIMFVIVFIVQHNISVVKQSR